MDKHQLIKNKTELEVFDTFNEKYSEFAISFVTKDVVKELTDRQKVILEMVTENPFVTTTEMSQKTGVVMRTIMRDINDLQEKGVIIRKGGRKDGEWIIIGGTETK